MSFHFQICLRFFFPFFPPPPTVPLPQGFSGLTLATFVFRCMSSQAPHAPSSSVPRRLALCGSPEVSPCCSQGLQESRGSGSEDPPLMLNRPAPFAGPAHGFVPGPVSASPPGFSAQHSGCSRAGGRTHPDSLQLRCGPFSGRIGLPLSPGFSLQRACRDPALAASLPLHLGCGKWCSPAPWEEIHLPFRFSWGVAVCSRGRTRDEETSSLGRARKL